MPLTLSFYITTEGKHPNKRFYTPLQNVFLNVILRFLNLVRWVIHSVYWQVNKKSAHIPLTYEDKSILILWCFIAL